MRFGWGRGFGSPTHIASEYLALQAMNAIPSTPPRSQVDPLLCTRVIVIAAVGIIVFMLCPWVWPITLADTAFFWSLTLVWGFINELRGVHKFHKLAPWEDLMFWLFLVSAAACPLLWIASAIRALAIPVH